MQHEREAKIAKRLQCHESLYIAEEVEGKKEKENSEEDEWINQQILQDQLENLQYQLPLDDYDEWN